MDIRVDYKTVNGALCGKLLLNKVCEYAVGMTRPDYYSYICRKL
jgi:hypothetical protein